MPSAGHVRLAVIGGVKTFVGGEPVSLRSRKANALLAFLALSGKVCLPREYLAGLLWSDVESAKARSSLRQTVTELRAAFGESNDFLIIGRNDITLRLTGISVDLQELLESLDSGAVPDVMLSRTSIVDSILYGFEDLSDGFRDWLQEYRVSTERRLMQLLEAGYRNRTLDFPTRKRMAESALLLDPMQEEACRALMQMCAEAGDLGTALRAYERLYTALDEEMGMEPSLQTQDLVVRIKQGEFEAAGAVAPHPAQPRPASARGPGAGAPRLAVMPMRLLGPERAPDHLAEMLLDDIVSKLAGLKEPAVISSNSTREFAADGSDAEAVRQKLAADYALYGKIGRAGETYRLSAQLVDLRTAVVVWADTFSVAEPDLFLTQSLIAGRIANQLVPSLNGSELRLTASYQPKDLTAYHLTLRARELMFELRRDSFREVEPLLRLALEKDPNFAPSHTAYANWYSLKMGQHWSDDIARDHAAFEAMARSAARLNGMQSPAIAMLGHNHILRGRDRGEAIGLLEQAVATSPNDAETLMWTTPGLAWDAQTDLAIDRGERAIALSPCDPLLFRFEHFLSIAYYFAGDFGRAAELGRSSMKRNPRYSSNLRVTAAAAASLGHRDEAARLRALAMQVEPGFRVARYINGACYIRERDRQSYGQALLLAGFPA